MLRGDIVGLRARHEADVPILDAELHDDLPVHASSNTRAWRPYSPGAKASPYAITEPSNRVAVFSVVTLAHQELAGDAVLWQIDAHNRSAHVGLALRPAFRGKGIGTDAVRVLCHYGFVALGLNRLQVDTLADNEAMLKAAERSGFVKEAVNREATWVMGTFADEVVLGLLAREWSA